MKQPARHELLRGTRRIDCNQIIEKTVALYAPDSALDHLVNFAALDRDSLQRWSTSLSGSIAALRDLKRHIDAEMAPASAVSRTCEICGASMLGRSDKRFCGASCRQRAQRQRHS